MTLPKIPHLLIESEAESAPTRPLRRLLADNPLVEFRTVDAYEACVRDRLPVLRVTPHPDLDACGYAAVHLAYTVRWSLPVPARQQVLPPVPGTNPSDDDSEGGTEWYAIGWHDLTPPQTLLAEPESPAVIEAVRAQQLAAAERAAATDDLTAFAPGAVDLLGGEDGARRLLRVRGRTAAQCEPGWDRSVAWRDLADRLDALRSDAERPRLTAVQRLALAGTERLILAARQEANVQALRALTGNAVIAETIGRTETAALGAITRQTLNAWHPPTQA